MNTSDLLAAFWDNLRDRDPGYAQRLLDSYRANRGLPKYTLPARRSPNKPRGRSVARQTQILTPGA